MDISCGMFDEFVGRYYRQLIPEMRKAGAGNVFVDTDRSESIFKELRRAIEDGLKMDWRWASAWLLYI